MSLRVEIHGIEKLKRRFEKLGRSVPAAVEKALIEEAAEIIGEAQKTVPVLTGELRTSAYIDRVKRNQHRSDVRAGYLANYASIVHEAPGGRGYHWLLKAATRVRRGFKAKVLSAIRYAVRG